MRYLRFTFDEQHLNDYFNCKFCFLMFSFNFIYRGYDIISSEEAVYSHLLSEFIISEREVEIIKDHFIQKIDKYDGITTLDEKERFYYARFAYYILERLKYLGEGWIDEMDDVELNAIFARLLKIIR